MLADRYAPMHAWGGGEMADTADLKSAGRKLPWGFESPPPYQEIIQTLLVSLGVKRLLMRLGIQSYPRD